MYIYIFKRYIIYSYYLLALSCRYPSAGLGMSICAALNVGAHHGTPHDVESVSQSVQWRCGIAMSCTVSSSCPRSTAVLPRFARDPEGSAKPHYRHG